MGSKDTSESSQHMDVSDEDSNMHDFMEAKELKDSKDCHWVVSHSPTFGLVKGLKSRNSTGVNLLFY
nr:hypothetical protein [Tanacetum cinerariifolium]